MDVLGSWVPAWILESAGGSRGVIRTHHFKTIEAQQQNDLSQLVMTVLWLNREIDGNPVIAEVPYLGHPRSMEEIQRDRSVQQFADAAYDFLEEHDFWSDEPRDVDWEKYGHLIQKLPDDDDMPIPDDDEDDEDDEDDQRVKVWDIIDSAANC